MSENHIHMYNNGRLNESIPAIEKKKLSYLACTDWKRKNWGEKQSAYKNHVEVVEGKVKTYWTKNSMQTNDPTNGGFLQLLPISWNWCVYQMIRPA